jgi:hypothetical protein
LREQRKMTDLMVPINAGSEQLRPASAIVTTTIVSRSPAVLTFREMLRANLHHRGVLTYMPGVS